jgi:hypothetical protein
VLVLMSNLFRYYNDKTVMDRSAGFPNVTSERHLPRADQVPFSCRYGCAKG